MKLSLFIYSILIAGLISCVCEKPTGQTEAEVLYKEAKELMSDERFILATEKLNQLKNKYPYSFYATPAELLQADILYLQESYTEAAAAYLLFRDFHPKHDEIPYVVYKIAESYFNQIPDTFDRDLQGAVESIKYYRELLDKYSTSQYSKDASEKISKCKEMLLNKEKYIADFYFKTEVFQAARWRYLDMLNHFEDKELRNHSMIRVVESSLKMKEYENCISYVDKYFQLLPDEGKKKATELKTKCTEEITQ